ncbi:MAG: ISAs1 family transposase [Anaerolineaceae bacterium]|nr:ISAs1 family transposase [Anaerolineaceae bacterium]
MEESSFSIIFSKLEDPRLDRTKQHKLLDIILMTICAVLCGAEGWVDVEEFGLVREAWLRSFLELPNGIPSHDTIGRVFRMLNGKAFERCFVSWVQTLAGLTGKTIAIDGKQIRGSKGEQGPLTLVSAWAGENGLVLAQERVHEKSNEITAIPALLELLDLKNKVVTIDAIGTQRSIAEQIITGGGDYVLAVKQNQGKLWEEMRFIFEVDKSQGFKDAPYDYAETVNKGHGRIETRRCWSVSDPEYLKEFKQDWPSLSSLVFIESERRRGDKQEVSTRYFITSMKGKALEILSVQRAHWGIENSLHWVLDIAFNEDRCRIRKDYAAGNFAIIRKMAINLLRQDKSVKIGAHGKRMRCALSNDYLLHVLSQ